MPRKSTKKSIPKKNITPKQEAGSILASIQNLEKVRNSKVISYFTSEKMPLELFATQVGSDVLPLVRNILEKFGKVKKITLLLNTNGGNLETPWPLVNLIREYCIEFEVIVADKALSAGTMISLGGDCIVMLPYSQLSPIDPQRNSVDDNKQVKSLEIEDITGFISFIKDKVGISEQNALADISKELIKEVSPTVLGSINRTHSLVRRLANNLLGLHKKKLPERQIKQIVEHLTQRLYSHRHLINRKEAKEVVGFDDMIEYADETTKTAVEQITAHYNGLMELDKEFNPITLLGANTETKIEVVRALMHSSEFRYNFKTEYHVIKTPPDPMGQQQIAVNPTANGWRKE